MPKQLSALPAGTEVRVFISKAEASEIIQSSKIGFPEVLEPGFSILPSIKGPATRKNSEGYDIIHRSLEKEKRLFELASRRSQFCGRDERVMIEDYHTYSRWCYPKTSIAPLGLEISYQVDGSQTAFFTSERYRVGNDDLLIIATINIFLELYGSCWIDEKLGFMNIPTKRVNWEFLPEGKWPNKESLDTLVKSIKHRVQRKVADRQLSKLFESSPTYVVKGLAGFNDYVAFVYEDKGLVVLESIRPNNATYIFDENWKSVSQLSKGEIVSSNLHLYRVIHSSSWTAKMNTILNISKAA